MPALFSAKIVSEQVNEVKMYSVFFRSYTSEDGGVDEGFIHGMKKEDAEAMKKFWVENPKMAAMFMCVTPGADYTEEEIEEMERENEAILRAQGLIE